MVSGHTNHPFTTLTAVQLTFILHIFEVGWAGSAAETAGPLMIKRTRWALPSRALGGKVSFFPPRLVNGSAVAGFAADALFDRKGCHLTPMGHHMMVDALYGSTRPLSENIP